MRNKAHIFSEGVNVFIGATGISAGDISLWQEVGWTTEKNRFFVGNIHTIDTNTGRPYLISKEFEFSSEALETDLAKITALEAFLNTRVDFLLVGYGTPIRRWILRNMQFSFEPDFTYVTHTPRILRLKGINRERKLTDVFIQRFIRGLPNYAVV